MARFMLEGQSMTLHNLLFCAHTLRMNHVTEKFLLVSCLNTRNHLLYSVKVPMKRNEKVAKNSPMALLIMF